MRWDSTISDMLIQQHHPFLIGSILLCWPIDLVGLVQEWLTSAASSWTSENLLEEDVQITSDVSACFIVLLLVYFPTWVCSLSCTCYPLRQKWWNAFWAWNHIRYSLLRNPSIGAQAVFHEIEFHCYISVKVILKSPLMQRMQYYVLIFTL